MVDDNRLQSIEKTLELQSQQLSEIARAVNTIAVQDEQIRTLQKDVGEIFPRVRVVETFQASCPRNTTYWLWLLMIPQAGAWIAVAYKLVVM